MVARLFSGRSQINGCLSCLAEVRLRQGRAEKKIGPASRSRGNPFKEPLINLRIMAHCAFDLRATMDGRSAHA